MPVHRSSLKNAPENPDIRVDVCVCVRACVCMCMCTSVLASAHASSCPACRHRQQKLQKTRCFCRLPNTLSRGWADRARSTAWDTRPPERVPAGGRGWLSAPPHGRSPDEVTAARSRSSWRGLSRGQQQPSVTQRVTEEGPSEGGLPCSFSQKAPTRGSRVVVRAGDTVAACA